MPKSRQGELNPKAKLTVANVEAIRQSRDSEIALAFRFDVSCGTISDIRRYRTWRHIPRKPRIDDSGEEWRLVTGFNDCYEVSNLGRIRSTRPQGRIRKQILGRGGYKVVVLNDGRQHRFLVHRLVAAAFFGPSPLAVNHK